MLQLASLIYDDACGLLTQHSSAYGLRTLDSLQLATFLNYCEKDQDSFVCADKKLFDVVKSEGVDAIFFKDSFAMHKMLTACMGRLFVAS